MKQTSVFKIIIRLLSLLGKYSFLVVLATFNGTLGFLLSMNISIFAALGIMSFLGYFNHISTPIIFTIILVSGFARGILRYFEQYFNHYLAFKLLAFLRYKMFDKLTKISLNKLDDKNKSEIISLIQADVETLEIFYAHTISPFFIALLTCTIMCLLVGFVVHVYVALMFLAAYLIIGLLIPICFYKFNKNYGEKYRKNLASFRSFYNETITSQNQIITNNKINIISREADKKTNNLLFDNKKLDRNNNIFRNITLFVISILNISIVLVGYALTNQSLFINWKLLFIFVVLISSFGPVIALASLPNNLVMTFASSKRIFEILDEKSLIEEKQSKDFKLEKLSVKNVTFGYNEKKPILNNVNFDINKNEIIGIYGSSGSGKTTLMKLLMHFYDPNKGEILINGNNIKEYGYEQLFNNINLFSQQTYLFKDTIYNNLIMANPNASKKEVIEACKNANIYEYIKNSKNGFETTINDLVDNLSDGEKQRIGLARVFLKRPQLLLLDEATSNIDALNEAFILNSLKENKKQMTIVVISHRKSTLSICDKVYLMNKNKMINVTQKTVRS